MSGWVAPYFSLGSTGCIKDEVSSQNRADSPHGCRGLGVEVQPIKYNLRIRKSLGDCEHARNVVLTRASMTCVARALSL